MDWSRRPRRSPPSTKWHPRIGRNSHRWPSNARRPWSTKQTACQLRNRHSPIEYGMNASCTSFGISIAVANSNFLLLADFAMSPSMHCCMRAHSRVGSTRYRWFYFRWAFLYSPSAIGLSIWTNRNGDSYHSSYRNPSEWLDSNILVSTTAQMARPFWIISYYFVQYFTNELLYSQPIQFSHSFWLNTLILPSASLDPLTQTLYIYVKIAPQKIINIFLLFSQFIM